MMLPPPNVTGVYVPFHGTLDSYHHAHISPLLIPLRRLTRWARAHHCYSRCSYPLAPHARSRHPLVTRLRPRRYCNAVRGGTEAPSRASKKIKKNLLCKHKNTPLLAHTVTQTLKGRTRHDFGREEFVREIWKWKDQKTDEIFGQLKNLGASLDWDRSWYPMSPCYHVILTILQFHNG